MKVAAGALGAGQLESRWGEYNATRAGSGLPTAAGGLMDRSEEGLLMEMRAWRNWSVDPWPKQEQDEAERVETSRKSGGSFRRALSSRAVVCSLV